MNLQELQASMLRGQQAQAQVQGLEQDYGRAEGQTQRSNYGQDNVLSVVEQLVGQSQGRQAMRETRPRLDKARAAVAENQAAQGGNTLRLAMEKAGRQEEAHTLKQATNAAKAENWQNDAGQKIPVIYGPTNEPMTLQGGAVPEGFYKAERTFGGRGSRGKAIGENDIIKLNKRVSNVTNTRELVGAWSDGFAQPAGMPTGFADAVAKGLAGNDLLQFVGEDVDQNVKDAAQWWAGWRMNFTSDKRHELFGATLTPGEERAWNAAELVRPGMDPKEINKRINTLQREAEESLMRRANISTASGLPANREMMQRAVGHMFDYDEAENMFSAMGTPVMAPEEQEAAFSTFSPEDQAEIAALEDPAERAAFIEFVMGEGKR